MEYKKITEVTEATLASMSSPKVLVTAVEDDVREVKQMDFSSLIPSVTPYFTAVYDDDAQTITVTGGGLVKVFSYELNTQGKITTLSLTSVTEVED